MQFMDSVGGASLHAHGGITWCHKVGFMRRSSVPSRRPLAGCESYVTYERPDQDIAHDC